MELLAPVKDKESAILAINLNADAIYCSGPAFSARVNAAITYDDLEEIIEYAHAYGKKVYVTFNTLIDQKILQGAIEYLDNLVKLKVDALIIQDLGLLNIIKKMYPQLEVHASTQMHIHNLDGIRFLMKQDVKRSVVPREMTLQQIKNIKQNSNIALEAFVHGALCTSYSGQCLYSFFDNKGSGNKGACKQNCRQLHRFKDQNKPSYLLSLKDLCLGEDVLKLEGIVDSLKIEGRLKNKDYLYSVISYYQSVLKHEPNQEMFEIANIAFNRQFTKGNLLQDSQMNNSTRVNNHGLLIGEIISVDDKYIQLEVNRPLHRLDNIRVINKHFEEGYAIDKLFDYNKNEVEEVECGRCFILNKKSNLRKGDVYLVKTRALEKIIAPYLKPYQQKQELILSIYIEINSPIIITSENGVYVSDFNVEKAKNSPMSKEQIIEQLSKTNDSPFKFVFSDININENVFIPKSLLNEFRRSIIEKELGLVHQDESIKRVDYQVNENVEKTFKGYKYMIKTLEQAKALVKFNIEEVYCDNLALLDKIKGFFDKVIPVLPRVVKDEKVNEYLKLIENYEHVMVSELGMYQRLISKKKIDLNYSLNLLNIESLALLNHENVENAILSFEANLKNLYALKDLETSFVAYTKPPYMIIDYQLDEIEQALNDNEVVELENHNHQIIEAIRYSDDLVELYAKKPLKIYNQDLKADYQFLNFTTENSLETETILASYLD